jgi:hypothetical protein
MHRFFVLVAGILHHPLAADHDVADGVAVAGEDNGIEQAFGRQGGDGGVLRVEHEEVGAAALLQRSDRPSKGLGAALEGLPVEARTHGSVLSFS